MKTVIVGVELAQPHDDSLLWAAAYCRMTRQELVGVVGYESTEAELPPDWYDEQIAGALEQGERAVAGVAAGVLHHVDVRYGDPRTVIPSEAAETKASTVVVGAHGSGGFHHVGLGTVAHHLARHLSIPMVIVPGSPRPLAGGTVVVGLDGSPGDVVTLDWAVALTKAIGGQLRVAHASDPMSLSYPHPYGATKSDHDEVVVARQVAQRAAGVGATTTIKMDTPLAVLTDVAEREDAAVVVVGRKGVGHLSGLLLGRVPSELPFEAGRPVAIVPRADS
jgi:nucleotide-binding universal stress UspA family protein